MTDPHEILKSVFGYQTFNPLQKEVIEQVLAGKDALVLMPTGGGKSLCFQVPALCLPGLTLVVSPLIALMRDQVEALRANGVKAAYLNSSQSQVELDLVLEQIRNRELKLVYISPEKLFASSILDNLASWHINLIAVDEAHCISFWGHDFRPEYTKLGRLREVLRGVPLIALTATADPAIRRDIASQLSIDESSTFLASFDRPNLFLSVQPGQKRFEKLEDFLRDHRGQAGIVYCLSRASTEELAQKLNRSGFKAEAYHAGMTSEARNRVQDSFLRDDTDIICATIAFGMG